MSLTPRQCEMIKSSWKEASQGGKPTEFRALRFVMDFYSHLFDLAPSTKSMFKGGMANQGKALVGMLDIVVNHIDSLATIKGDVELLGQRHAKYGVTSNMYVTAGRALVMALAPRIPDDEDKPECASAWMDAYSFLASIMCNAAGDKLAMTSIRRTINPADLPEKDFKEIVKTKKTLKAHLRKKQGSDSVTFLDSDISPEAKKKKSNMFTRMFKPSSKVK
ncbi:hypothetical protein SARC_12208 [Sphaeroforma arctica JP610]|uniref:Globin domain-containing protein n=1 Tax=Sphaeroforma arctica JP610 TaxID=667725 RepID=A0A0L0FER9_9EUKA|nr:hypothetical protein SARC_12208 [Sphaeroforma arctica JP610]KNC75264.1 hypothetical protein SARC_12208 [Sphaeroforma arctica JP610]|eukprot:XP_014149166.1 hypothetical protein SARC_12208 [Sphaeroforma arctica JP610]